MQIEINKTLKNYFKQLLIIGIIYIFIGIFLSWAILKSTAEFPFIYLLLMVISAFLGYIAVIYTNPGGNVNYYFTKHIPTKNEETLNSLIIKHRSKTFITLTLLIFVMTITYKIMNIHNPNTVLNLDVIGVALFLPGVTFLCLGTGVKYVSAWWNIIKYE